MTLEEAREVLRNCDAYLGAPGWVPEGTDPKSVVMVDGNLSLLELEALIVVMKARMEEPK